MDEQIAVIDVLRIIRVYKKRRDLGRISNVLFKATTHYISLSLSPLMFIPLEGINEELIFVKEIQLFVNQSFFQNIISLQNKFAQKKYTAARVPFILRHCNNSSTQHLGCVESTHLVGYCMQPWGTKRLAICIVRQYF